MRRLLPILIGALLCASPAPSSAQIGAAAGPPIASIVDCLRPGAERGLPPEASPTFVTTCFGSLINYDRYLDPRTSTYVGDSSAAEPAAVVFGDSVPDSTSEPPPSSIAGMGDVGAVYGLAFASGTNPAAQGAARSRSTYLSAYTKRGTRFGDAGPGAIYRRVSSTGAIVPFVIIPNAGPGPQSALGGIHRRGDDAAAIPFVGVSSLGDLELDPQERYLYTVNLYSRLVYQVDTWAVSPQSRTIALPDVAAAMSPCAARGGTQDYRPFALAVTRTSLYLGGVCSGATRVIATDPAYRVDRFDLTSWAWTGAVVSGQLDSFDAARQTWRWRPWQNNTDCSGKGSTLQVCSQPLLTDIVLDERRNMLLGFRDRYGDITGPNAERSSITGGDLLRAAWNGGGWDAPPPTELYDDRSVSGLVHEEAASGGLAYVPGTHAGGYGGEVVTTFEDPYVIESFGAAWFDVAGGGTAARQEIYQTNASQLTFAKAAGLGDVELLCAWAAAGDTVWRDSDGDGSQDTGEPGINGVRLQIYDAADTRFATPLGEVTTGRLDGRDGQFRIYLPAFRGYTLRIDPAEFAVGQTLDGMFVTRQDRGGDDTLDSDADQIARTATIAALDREQTTPDLDIGLAPLALADGLIGDLVWRDADGDGIQDAGEGGVAGVTLQLLACRDRSPACSDPVLYQTATTTSAGYSFASLPPNYYALRLPAVPSGYLLSPADQGPSDARDSDIIGATGQSAPLAIVSGSADRSRDIGLTPNAANVSLTGGGPARVLINTAASYTLSYAAASGGEALDSRVTATIPADSTIVTAPGASRSGSTLTWLLGTLRSGDSGTLTFQLSFSAPGPHSIPASISTISPGDLPGDNATTIATVVERPNLAIVQSAPASVAPGETFAYRLTISNRPAQPATSVPAGSVATAAGVVMTDQLPSGATFVSASVAPSSSGGGRLTWSIGALVEGESRSIDVVVRAQTAAPLPASLLNRASVSTTTQQDAPADNSADATTLVRYPDLTVSLAAPAERGEGSTLRYKLGYSNAGDEQADGSRLSLTLPDDVALISASNSGYTVSGKTLTWLLGTLTPGAGGTIDVDTTVSIGAAARSPLSASAAVGTTTPEPDLSDNRADASTRVVGPPTPALGSGTMQLAIHSTLDPLARDADGQNAVYRSGGSELSWPLGEVLDFTPRIAIALPPLSAPESDYFVSRARVTGWSLVRVGADAKDYAADGRDDMGRGGCRAGSRALQPGLSGCGYSYIGGASAADATEPTEAQMAGQAHIYWGVGLPLRMRGDVYTLAASGLGRGGVTVMAQVLVEVINRETGAVVASDTIEREQTFVIRLIAPRSLR